MDDSENEGTIKFKHSPFGWGGGGGGKMYHA